ncbi:21715_t:CDS:2, partial [Gigaspora rosea]
NIKEKVGVIKTGFKAVIAPQIEQTSLNQLHGNRKWSASIKGDFQLENATTTVLASDLLRKRGLKFSIIANYHGIA